MYQFNNYFRIIHIHISFFMLSVLIIAGGMGQKTPMLFVIIRTGRKLHLENFTESKR